MIETTVIAGPQMTYLGDHVVQREVTTGEGDDDGTLYYVIPVAQIGKGIGAGVSATISRWGEPGPAIAKLEAEHAAYLRSLPRLRAEAEEARKESEFQAAWRENQK